MKQPINLTINSEQHALLVEAYWSLLDTLRDHLHLTVPRRSNSRRAPPAGRAKRRRSRKPEDGDPPYAQRSGARERSDLAGV